MKLLSSSAIAVALSTSLSAGELSGSANHGSFGPITGVYHDSDYLGFDLTRGWFEPAGAHSHSNDSPDGRARYIHPLTIEAAFNDNDFFIDYAYNSFDDEDEHEIEVELEYALTRRLGIVIESAYEFENEDGSTEEGFADLSIASRFVLVENKNFIATASVEFGIPIGDDDFTADEFVVEPSLLTWFDLGNGFTLNTAVGAEFETESNETELFIDAALVKDLGGAFAVSFESRNTIELRGEERGDITSEATLGLIYQLNGSTSLRGGWSFPIDNDGFNSGGVLSVNYSF